MKLLIIDDEKGICDYLSDFFEHRGHQALTVTDPLKAMAVIEKENPPIVILDKLMPKMDGLTLLAKIKKYDKNIKVIMVTVSDEPQTKKDALKAGVDDFITKPFSSDYLESVVISKLHGLV